MNTMTHEQALEVLKRFYNWRDLSHPQGYDFQQGEVTQALTIAIEVMEKRKREIIIAYNAGLIGSIRSGVVMNAEEYYNSLTAPAGSGDEKP